MRARQLVQRMKRIEDRMPKPPEQLRFRIVWVNPDRSIAGYTLIENGTRRRVGPNDEELVDDEAD